MTVKKVRIGTIDNIKALNKAAERMMGDVDVVSGKYVVDAKSIMGIFSIDVSKVVEVHIHSENDIELNAFLDAIEHMIVE